MESNDSDANAPSARSGAWTKVAIVVVLALAVGAALYMKNQTPATAAPGSAPTDVKPVEAAPEPRRP